MASQLVQKPDVRSRMSGGGGLWSGRHTDSDSRAFRTVTDCDKAARKKGDCRVETGGQQRARQGETPCRAWGSGPGCGSGHEVPPPRGSPVQRAVRRMLQIGHTPTRTTTIGRWSLGDLVGTAGFEPATPATPLQCATGLRHVPRTGKLTWEVGGLKVPGRNSQIGFDPPRPGTRFRES